MASGDLKDELNCSICLNLYTDPVFLRCGHNFCRSCIVPALDAQDGSGGGYSCPDCRVEYPERPTLEKNGKLGNIVKCFLLSTQPDVEETGIFCTYCNSPVPAVESCLLCEVSLCDYHQTVYCKTTSHILMEPTNSFANKRCSIHKKEILKLYCPQDEAFVCVLCFASGKHNGHWIYQPSKKERSDLMKMKAAI